MRCKLHPYANAVGVCAPCLRDRLLALAAERDRAAVASDDASSCGSSPQSLPLPARRPHAARGFPRSVSPYVAHRRSDVSAFQPSLLFFRTPQVGPSVRCADDEEPAEEDGQRCSKVGTGPARRRRSFLAAIFGGRRGSREEEEAGAKEKEPPRRSSSWLSAIVRRKRRPDAAAASASAVSSHPAPQPDEEPESPGATSSTSWWVPSPSLTRQHRRVRHGVGAGGDGISAGFAVCLTPLVPFGSASAAGRRRCQPPDPSSLGDGSHRRHASASFGRNTSRKLADMSRFR